MKINITKKEYKTLVEMIEIAGWVLHAHLVKDDPDRKRYKELEQTFYSYAEAYGFGKLIQFDKHFGKFFPTKEYEGNSPAHDYIDEYDNHIFWDDLVERLVLRALIEQEGEENIRNMNIEERFRKEFPFREKYENEFEENGLKNIIIG